MRIVLDTNVLVRAAANEEGLAGRLLQEISAVPHVLVTSPYVLSEIARVLAPGGVAARPGARCRLSCADASANAPQPS